MTLCKLVFTETLNTSKCYRLEIGMTRKGHLGVELEGVGILHEGEFPVGLSNVAFSTNVQWDFSPSTVSRISRTPAIFPGANFSRTTKTTSTNTYTLFLENQTIDTEEAFVNTIARFAECNGSDGFFYIGEGNVVDVYLCQDREYGSGLDMSTYGTYGLYMRGVWANNPPHDTCPDPNNTTETIVTLRVPDDANDDFKSALHIRQVSLDTPVSLITVVSNGRTGLARNSKGQFLTGPAVNGSTDLRDESGCKAASFFTTGTAHFQQITVFLRCDNGDPPDGSYCNQVEANAFSVHPGRDFPGQGDVLFEGTFPGGVSSVRVYYTNWPVPGLDFVYNGTLIGQTDPDHLENPGTAYDPYSGAYYADMQPAD